MIGNRPLSRRFQQTIRRPADVSGIGFFTGADVTVRFLPAAPNHGIAFQRTDCPNSRPIPALLEFTVPRRRRTAIACDGVVVEMTEHVLAALAGLQIDNCLIQLNAPELPGCDGSSIAYVNALQDVGCVEQEVPRQVFAIKQTVGAKSEDGKATLQASPTNSSVLSIRYSLNYGTHSPIPPQSFTVEITPETFVREIAFARTFVLESEVEALRAQGYGCRTTAKDLLVFGTDGVIDNSLHTAEECARHKILDCLGDLALIGCDVTGRLDACRSGHALNREIVRQLKLSHPNDFEIARRNAA